MEFLLHFLTVLFVTFIISCTWWYTSIPKNLPPGPLGLPFFGSIFDTWKALTLPQKLCEWTKRYGTIYKFYVGPKLVLVLADWDHIHEALIKQGDAYLGRPEFASALPPEFEIRGKIEKHDKKNREALELEFWKIQRRFAVSTLREFGVGRPVLEPRIKEEAQCMWQEIDDQRNQPFDPAQLVATAGVNIICGLVFGKRFDYDDKVLLDIADYFRKTLNESKVSMLAPFVLFKEMAKLAKCLFPQGRSMAKTHLQYMNFIRTELKIALNNYQDGDEPTNFVEAFRKAQITEQHWTFTDDQLVSMAGKLFLGGAESTATTLRWALFYMAHYPEIQEKCFEEMKKEFGVSALVSYSDRAKLPFTNATMFEVQRIATVAIIFPRKTTEASTIGGYDIPSDTIVVPLFSSILMDPNIYPNPEVFDPNRFINHSDDERDDAHSRWVPFGLGKRNCFGAPLAKMDLFIFFTALISRYRFYFPLNEPKPPLRSANIAINRSPIPYRICAERRDM